MEAYVIGRSMENGTARIVDFSPSAPFKIKDYAVTKINDALCRVETDTRKILKLENVYYRNLDDKEHYLIDLDKTSKGTRYLALKLLQGKEDRFSVEVISEFGDKSIIGIEKCFEMGDLLANFNLLEPWGKRLMMRNINRTHYFKVLRDNGTIECIETDMQLDRTSELKEEDEQLYAKLAMIGKELYRNKSCTGEEIYQSINRHNNKYMRKRLNLCRALDETARPLENSEVFDIACRTIQKAVRIFELDIPKEEAEKLAAQVEGGRFGWYSAEASTYDENLRKVYYTEKDFKNIPNRISIVEFSGVYDLSEFDVLRSRIVIIVRNNKLVTFACYFAQEYLDAAIKNILLALRKYILDPKETGNITKILDMMKFDIGGINDINMPWEVSFDNAKTMTSLSEKMGRLFRTVIRVGKSEDHDDEGYKAYHYLSLTDERMIKITRTLEMASFTPVGQSELDSTLQEEFDIEEIQEKDKMDFSGLWVPEMRIKLEVTEAVMEKAKKTNKDKIKPAIERILKEAEKAVIKAEEAGEFRWKHT